MTLIRRHKRKLAFQDLENRRLLAAVNIPDDLTGPASQVVSAPVNIDSANGVRGVEIRLSYNTDILDLDSGAISAGSVWDGASDTQLTANVDDVAGTVVIFVSSSSALGNVSGSLVKLNFTISGTAPGNATAKLDLSKVILNEGQIPIAAAPVLGPDSSDGLITVVTATGSDRIGGFVYADTNTNSQVDPHEGIAGVVITLVNQATQAEQQTTTAADGSYEFINLPAGSYTIKEQQPKAYLDGGENELVATVVTGVAISDQNFRELGLLPQFVYTRLLTTLTQPVGSEAWATEIAQINSDAENAALAPPPAHALASAATNAGYYTVAPAVQSATTLGGSSRLASSDLLATNDTNKNELADSTAIDRVLAEGLF